MKEEKTPYYNEKGLENLANGIIIQAVTDYRKALRGFSSNSKSSSAIAAECERFFRSEWFSVLTNVDGEYLIINIRKEYGL
jgi:hypothetical protein